MKQYRKDELTLRKQGGAGSIYILNDKQVIKTYESNVTRENLEKIVSALNTLEARGIPVMKAYEVVQVDDSFGIVFEMMQELSVAKTIMQDESRFDEMAAKMAELFMRMHTTDVSDILPDFTARVLSWIDKTEEQKGITRHCAKNMRRLVSLIPKGNTLLHCDFHEGNVKVRDGQLILIDLDELAFGNPLYDLAFHWGNHVAVSKNDEISTKSIGMDKELVGKIYYSELNTYFNGRDYRKVKQQMIPLGLMFYALTPARMDTVYSKKKVYQRSIKVLAAVSDIYISAVLRFRPNLYQED